MKDALVVTWFSVYILLPVFRIAMSVRTYIYIYIYRQAYTYTYIHIYIHTNKDMHNTYMHTYKHTYDGVSTSMNRIIGCDYYL